jgi:hypothetical protein
MIEKKIEFFMVLSVVVKDGLNSNYNIHVCLQTSRCAKSCMQMLF